MRKLAVVPAIAALALTGCGSKSFESQANGICKDFNKQQKALGTPKSVAQLKSFAPKVKNAFQASLTKLEALKPPKSKAADYQALLTSGKAQLALFDQLVAAATSGDTTTVQSISAQGSANNKTSNAIAKRIGLNDCAKG
ncbi:MAG TPA: hypothetical protein VIL64_05680 [Solirubrobacteraceae bacterium]